LLGNSAAAVNLLAAIASLVNSIDREIVGLAAAAAAGARDFF